jgi:hypothetical protein
MQHCLHRWLGCLRTVNVWYPSQLEHGHLHYAIQTSNQKCQGQSSREFVRDKSEAVRSNSAKPWVQAVTSTIKFVCSPAQPPASGAVLQQPRRAVQKQKTLRRPTQTRVREKEVSVPHVCSKGPGSQLDEIKSKPRKPDGAIG